MLRALTNLLLIASSMYAMYSLTPAEHPYAYTAASFSLVHGLLGLVRSYIEEPEECGRDFMISSSILEVILLPLANVEFYLLSDKSDVALVHGLSLIPLFYDMICKIGDDWDSSTETLKDLALLGNVGSTAYLAVNDGIPIYGGVAATALMARYGAALVDSFKQGLGASIGNLGHAGIVALMTYALVEG
ncbi:uncharacterized protein LOC108112547 [Drosophila eugracilis]|uniref:uncharacterized protein LOC108112547 n=1 Tax=Drosophila eugracilis TaxID=29029 RepID=UPI0007E7D128|nr:uncharacterized protein LOC108112547 [Drosophila eugracilis]